MALRPTWKLPVTVLPVYIAGAVAGFLIVFICIDMKFRNSLVVEGSVTRETFVFPVHRRWEIEYPEVTPSATLSFPARSNLLSTHPLLPKRMTTVK